jgi:hypothetical protein
LKLLTVRATSKDFQFALVDAPPEFGIGFVDRDSVGCVNSFVSQLCHVRLIGYAGK